MRDQYADPTHCRENLSSRSECLEAVRELEYDPIEAAMAMVLNEAGATYTEAAAFIAINGRKPRARQTPAAFSNGRSSGCLR